MKLYLFWWGITAAQFKLIEDTINKIHPRQILHIPFARSLDTEIALWWKDWFIKHINLHEVEYLNADNTDDINKIIDPVIVITWWGQNKLLLEKIQKSPKLLELIKNAKHIIGESAGSMVLCQYMRINLEKEDKLIQALWIVKNTIIEPHYTQRQRQSLLEKEMKETGMKYGIGLDENTWIEFDLEKFPHEWKKIGDGNVEIKENKE